jgi:hypothetical protein
MGDLQVIREDGIARQIGDQAEARAAIITGTIGKAVQPVRQLTALPAPTITNAPKTMKK